MASKSSCDDGSIGLFIPDKFHESWTNAILLPERQKSKHKCANKVNTCLPDPSGVICLMHCKSFPNLVFLSALKKSKSKQPPPMSKSKHKKLKRLQEENGKKLLQSESIKILECLKYKISEGAYSLMHSSGTIGKAETMREKCRRAVQLSKAGLEIPEDGPPLKKGSFKYTLENEASSRIESDQSGPEEVSCSDNILLLRCSKRDDCDHEGSVKGHLKPGGKSSADAENLPVQEIQENDKVFCMVEIQNNSELISHGTYTSDFLLKRYSVIILDEAHERSLNTDILIGLLSRVIELRKKLYVQQEKMLSGVRINPENSISPLKLVLMSATLRVEDFSSNRKLFHESPPLLEVPIRQFPVTTHFTKTTQHDYLGQAYKKVISIHKRLPQGGILVFVTGQREVEFLCKRLSRASRRFSENSSRRKGDNEITTGLELDMKDISEAFETTGCSPDQQTDGFSIYDEDYDSPEMDSHSSDSEPDSELEDDSEDENFVKSETSEKSGLILDYLRDSESLSSLKASFESLAGNLSIPKYKEKSGLPDVPTVEECLEPTVKSPGALYVLPLYAMLPASAQLRVFEEVPEGERLVVVATNVAETSLTIPGIKYVVDTGKEKVKKYNYNNGVATYEVQWISKASAAQRAGRAGRTGPGHCYRLYSSAAFSKDDIFPEFSFPEISKIPVDGVVLLMKFMGIDKVANFPFPTPPERQALLEAENCLRALEALDSQGRLTPMGRSMAQYPMSPRHSRMLLTVIQILKNQQGHGRANFVLGYAVSAAASLSFSNPFMKQFGDNHGAADDMDGGEMQDQQQKQSKRKRKAMAKEVRDRLRNSSSDALTIAYALQLFELSKNPVEFCSTNSLHLKTMEDMSKLRKQLLQLIFHQSKLCPEFSWNSGSFEDVERSWRNCSDKQLLKLNGEEEKLLGKAICAGWADRVAKRVRMVSKSSEEDGKVRAGRYNSCASDDPVYLHRWSSVSHLAPEFLVYTELLQTKRLYMHGATLVNPEWLIKYASPLCTFSAPLTDPKPYYDAQSDQVLCWVRATFGRHNWQLPLHSLPIKNDSLRVSVFACALLEGSVLPSLRSVQQFLAAPPSSILKPKALGQRRVGDLVSRLRIGSRTIDSQEMLKEAWNVDPQFLYLEIQSWFQKDFHHHFNKLWEQMHREVLKMKRGKQYEEGEMLML